MNWRLMRIRFIDWSALPKLRWADWDRMASADRNSGTPRPAAIIEARRVVSRTTH